MLTSWSSKISKDLNWTLRKKQRLRKRTNTCAPVNPQAAMGTREKS